MSSGKLGAGYLRLSRAGDSKKGEMRAKLGNVAAAFGKDIFAGVAGTAAMAPRALPR
jgi:hypothetical protein